MKLLKKSLALGLLLSSSLFANEIDDKILSFEENRIKANPNVKLNNLSINMKKTLDKNGWYGYIFNIEVNVQNKNIKAKDVLFTNGDYIATDLLDISTGKSLKDKMTPNLTKNYYKKEKLIAGKNDAKNKLVIFSDPLCPFCMDFVPDLIKSVQNSKKDIALYYYHFPLLRIHAAAGPLSKLMEIAKHKGIKDVEIKVYEADWEEYFSSKETKEEKILNAFNKMFKTNITLAQLQDKKLEENIQNDMKMGDEVMVRGTPTLFVNGEKDSDRTKFMSLIK